LLVVEADPMNAANSVFFCVRFRSFVRFFEIGPCLSHPVFASICPRNFLYVSLGSLNYLPATLPCSAFDRTLFVAVSIAIPVFASLCASPPIWSIFQGHLQKNPVNYKEKAIFAAFLNHRCF